MSSGSQADRIVTPEAVALNLDVAGLGSRMIATAIDLAIQIGVVTGLGFLLATTAGENIAATVTLIISLIVVVWGYYPLFEGLWNGRTPGKRILRIRVVRTDGQPIGMGPAVVRNLVRIIDFLPSWYMVGALTMVLTKRSQRLGDLAAGTFVVRERPLPLPSPLTLPAEEAGWAPVDTAGITEREFSVARSFLERRQSLDPEARRTLAAQLAAAFRGRLGGDSVAAMDDELLLETVVRSYRRRYEPVSAEAAPSPAPLPPPP